MEAKTKEKEKPIREYLSKTIEIILYGYVLYD